MAGESERPAEGGDKKTRGGSYFVSNYPPFAHWSPEERGAVTTVLERRPEPDTPLGIYVHIPFCRRRCDFCYFRVYTDKNSREIRRYLAAVESELACYVDQPYLAGRAPRFVYFGGGTPSYLSADQMSGLFDSLRGGLDWSEVEEVTFECEPGTLSRPKIETLRALGVTRLSLGVENFDPEILERNNRAHRAEEIHRTYGIAREVGFEQINIDLIAGMVGETDANWERCLDETLRLLPESVTVYQMEIPLNTTIYKRMRADGVEEAPVADWETKRRWTREAFERLRSAGYRQSSAYTVCRGEGTSFVYRDALWHGADMLGLGVSSFSHLGGVHFQNEASFVPYVERVEAGERPLARAYALSPEERFLREFVLQLKTGRVERAYFRDKFGIDPLERLAAPLEAHARAGLLVLEEDGVRTTGEGLMVVDEILPPFFLEEHRPARSA